jgi:hypothetical protein
MLTLLLPSPVIEIPARNAKAAWGVNAVAYRTHNFSTDYIKMSTVIDNVKVCSCLLVLVHNTRCHLLTEMI